ncbi:MAG: hypothetical protein MHM6MM_002160 [Cercozoa sp. M6MM]
MDRSECLDILCFLRVLFNPDDNTAFSRIINVPPRGLGDVQISNIANLAKTLPKKSVWHAARLLSTEDSESLSETERTVLQDSERLRSTALIGLQELLSHVKDARKELREMSLSTVLHNLLQRVGYYDYLSKQKDNSSRWQNLGTFQSILKQHQERENNRSIHESADSEAVLRSFLEKHVTLQRKRNNQDSVVQLSTIHSGKGLEWDTVFVAGVELNTLPLWLALQSDADDEYDNRCLQARLEEERRVLYVAMTRARNKLVLTHVTQHRLQRGKVCSLSPFLQPLRDETDKRLRDDIVFFE